MPSYQLFRINEGYNIKTLQDEDILSSVGINKDDPKTLKVFLESAKKSYRNLNFEPLEHDFAIKMSMEEYSQFQDKQTLWIRREKKIIKHNQFLLIGKTEKKIEKLLMIYLRDRADLTPVIFKDRHLWNIWKKMQKMKREDIKLHRLILKKTYIDADKINEMNIHTEDVSEIGVIEDIVRQAEQVSAITIKISGYYPDNKWLTTRVDKNGSILVYGKHETKIISEFLEIFVQSIL